MDWQPWKEALMKQVDPKLFAANGLEQTFYKTVAWKFVKNTVKGFRGATRIALERLEMSLHYWRYKNDVIARDGKYCYAHAKVGIYHDGQELDHEVSLWAGGKTELSNLRWICMKLNRKKGKKSGYNGLI